MYAFINSQYEQSDILAIDILVQSIDVYFLTKIKTQLTYQTNYRLVGYGITCLISQVLNTLGASKLMGLVGYGKFEQYFYDIFELLTSGPIIEKKQEIHQLIDIHKYGQRKLSTYFTEMDRG